MFIPQSLLDRMAKACHDGCGITCGDRPCAGCMAGGMCDRSTCRCDDEQDESCSDPAGHDWAINEESDRCYCVNCGADGDG